MRKCFPIVALLSQFGTLAVTATSAPPLHLPPVDWADTETVTNCPLPAVVRQNGTLAFTLCCRATPTNDVEVAFGRDADANGVLDLEEIGISVGWRRGMWFVRRGADGEQIRSPSPTTNNVKTLSWSLPLDQFARPRRLVAEEEGHSLFPVLVSEPPMWLHAAEWDLLRLVGRGVDEHDGGFAVKFSADGFSVIMR